jgi:RHS repeat-associated protein
LYDGVTPVQELAGGSPTANLLTGGVDEFFTRTDSSGARHYMTDALGSTVALGDGAGTTQTEYTFEPFGGMTISGASSSNSFTFTGREADGTGLLYYRARYQDPRLQRFIAEDPLGFGAGDTNLYTYVGNAPQDLVDPSGTIAAPLLLPVAACLGGAAGAVLGNTLIGRKADLLSIIDGCLSGMPAWRLGPALAPFLPGLPGFGPRYGPSPASPPVPGPGPIPSDPTVDAFRRQLQEHGRRALERSLRSIEANLADHLRRLEAARNAGGPTSSLEREIRTFQHQITTIRRLLGGG